MYQLISGPEALDTIKLFDTFERCTWMYPKVSGLAA